MPSEAPPGSPAPVPSDASSGGPQGKDPRQLWAKVVGTGEQSDIGGADCELRECQGASGNLVLQQGRGASEREGGEPQER